MTEENRGSVIIKKTTIWKGISSILAILLIISIYTGGLGFGSDKETKPQEQPGKPSLDMDTLADDDDFLGPKDAKVVVVEFSDFECPYCAASAGTHEELISRFKAKDPNWEAAVPKLKELAKEGKIKFVFRDYPLGFHKQAQKAAEAAECAGEQGKYYEMHDELFEKGVAGGVDSFKQYASDLGLNTNEFDECLDSGEMASEVAKDLKDGQAAGVSGTPGFIVNGQLVSGAQPFSVFKQIIDAELAK